MMLHNTYSIALYETKTLLRSWFFRLFALFSLVILFFYNIFVYVNPDSANWINRAVASNIPYANLIMVNVVQAIIAVFLASDFLQKDKKLDTAEVIFVRPVANAEYILGKTLGIVGVFLIFNIVVLSIALIFNILAESTPVVWQAYFWYPLILSLPSLVFILGLSFVLMVLFKNQALTYLVVFGYVAVTLFFLPDKAFNVFNYLGTSLPMTYSDFIGFGNSEMLLLQRLSYFLVGSGFIILTIRIISRLPNSLTWVNTILIISIAFILAGGYSGYRYYNHYDQLKAERANYIHQNNKYVHLLPVEVKSNKISLIHKGEEIAVSNKMHVSNVHHEPLDTLIFSLNPALKITSLSSKSEVLRFKREGAIVLVFPNKPLKMGEKMELQWEYQGGVTESITALDTQWNNFFKPKTMRTIKMQKRTAFLTANYVMLTPSTLWYPVAGVTYNQHNHLNRNINFTTFLLDVRCAEKLSVVSQGELERKDGLYHFTPENPLSGLSLVIGEYEKKSITVDEVEYALYIRPGHDFYSQYFTSLKDTMETLIQNTKADYERNLDLYYPFNRFTIVEVPVQFHAFQQRLSEAFETVQPEMVFLPEKGMGLSGADFPRLKNNETNRNRRSDNVRTPTEIEAGMFRRFLYSTLFSGTSRTVNMVQGSSAEFSGKFSGIAYNDNPHSVFPLYYNHLAGFNSDSIPYFNRIVESYLKEGFNISIRETMDGGMTEEEKANVALQKKSMIDILNDDNSAGLYASVIKQKGNYLFSLIQEQVGLGDFDNFLYYFVEDHRYQNKTFADFKQALKDSLNFDIEPYMDFWINSRDVASYIVSNVEFIETRDNFGQAYLVKYQATNYADVPGILYISIRTGGGFGRGAESETEDRIISFKPNETKDIQILLYDQPRLVTINTMISSNIPRNFVQFSRNTEKKNIPPKEYALTIHNKVKIDNSSAIIVDNQDAGFSLVSEKQTSKLKNYIERNKKVEELLYKNINSWAPTQWTAISHTAMYGAFIRSAYYTRGGKGEMKARWTTTLPESGMYDVFTYIPTMAMMSRGRPSEGGGRRGPRFADKDYTYPYQILTGEGLKDVPFALKNTENGWNRMGTFYFNADSTYIELSNNISGGNNRVFADAVKWVKVNY